MANVAINFRDIEDAIQDWFFNATDICTVWRNQSAPQPPYPFASLSIIDGPTRVGGRDERRFTFDPLAAAGKESTITICGLRTITVSCQVYAGKDGIVDPDIGARQTMLAAQTSLGFQSVLEKLSIAGLSVIDEGPIQNIDDLIEDAFVSRSNMDVIFGVASNIQESGPILEQTKLSSDLGTGTPAIELDDELFGV